MTNDVFKKYIVRLQKEGWFRAAICGLIAGFSAMLITAAICWYVGFKGFWVSIVILIGLSAAVTPLFYYFIFRPTQEKLARRLDALGLDERIITMHELEGQTSFIAMKQREDAVKALGGINAKYLSFVLSVPVIVAVSLLGVFGVGMTTYSAVAEVSGKQLIEKWTTEDPEVYNISYETEGKGQVIGNAKQSVAEGEDGSAVIAVADEGYVFVGWSDGEDQPYRVDTEIKADNVYTAVFASVQADEGEEEFEPDPDVGSGDNNNNNNNDRNNERDDRPKDFNNSDEDNEDGLKVPNAGELEGGKDNDADQVYDGKTFYGDETYQDALNEAIESSSSNSNLSDDEREIISDYFEAIAK